MPQFHLLAAGNPRPETVRVSPLYQITIDDSLRAEAAGSRRLNAIADFQLPIADWRASNPDVLR